MKNKKKQIKNLNSDQTNSIELNNLFIKRKFKTLYGKIEENPKLLHNVLNDNKTIIHYSIQTNNFKLLKKLINLDNDILIKDI